MVYGLATLPSQPKGDDMGTKIVTVCDFHTDETPAEGQVEFAVGTTSYALDLCEEHLAEVNKILANLTKRVPQDQQRPTRSAGVGRQRGGRVSGPSYSAIAVRKWAEANGIKVAAQGRVSADVLAKFRAAGN